MQMDSKKADDLMKNLCMLKGSCELKILTTFTYYDDRLAGAFKNLVIVSTFAIHKQLIIFVIHSKEMSIVVKE